MTNTTSALNPKYRWPLRWRIKRWTCRVFHKQHIKPTLITYAKATGVTWYCNKCYKMAVLYRHPGMKK